MDAPTAAISNADLVERIVAGDAGAERQFVQQYQLGIRAVVRRYCRPADPCVDDIVQDVIKCVLEKLRGGELRTAAALPGYVQTIAANSATAEYRSRARMAEAPEDALHALAAEGDPVRELEQQEQVRRVRALLAQLPIERDRQILKLFYLKERSKADVCAALGIDESHFHRVVHRARERLRHLAEGAGLASP